MYYLMLKRYYGALMPTSVTSKGQVTIPTAVRERLGIERGDAVDFELTHDGRFVLVNRRFCDIVVPM